MESRPACGTAYRPVFSRHPSHPNRFGKRSLKGSRRRQHFDSAPLNQHVQLLRLARPLTLIQREDLPSRILIPGTRFASHGDIGQHEHMRHSLTLPTIPHRVCRRERVREGLPRNEIHHDFVRVMPHRVPVTPIFPHVIRFPTRQPGRIYSHQIDQHRRSFQRFIQVHINCVLPDRSGFARLARTATAENGH